MKITKALRDYMVKNHGVAEGASEDDVRKAVSDALFKGDLDLATLTKLTTVPAAEGEQRVREIVKESVDPLSQKIDKMLEVVTASRQAASEAEAAKKAEEDAAKAAEAEKQKEDAELAKKLAEQASKSNSVDAQKAYSGGDTANADAQVRLKAVVEQFDDTRTAATYDKSSQAFSAKHLAGQRLWTGEGPTGRYLDMPTERTKAIAGAWFKHMLARAFRSGGRPVPRKYQLSELDRKLVEYAAHECKFVGPYQFDPDNEEARDWHVGTKLTSDLHIKAVLDDSTSGGLEAVPIEFDDAAILTPLLNGEVFPYVTVRNVTRRRIEGFSVGNPTMNWGTAEGSQISLFDTDSLIAAFDNSIYPVAGAIEIGMDFEADSPVNVGDIIMNRFGERYRKELDDVIVNGNGTSQPEGVFQAAGTATVSADNTSTGPPTIGDYESLIFGVAKEFREEARPGNRAMFIGTDTSYARVRALPIHLSYDLRRIFGMDEESYVLFGHRYAISGNITNRQIGYFCMNRYRMYRRQGYEVRVVTEDAELARKNQRLILVRARFGGALELGGAGAVISDGQT